MSAHLHKGILNLMKHLDKIKQGLFLLALIGVLAGCLQSAPIVPVPTPIAGKVTVKGRIIDATTSKSASGMAVRLAEARPEMDMWIDNQLLAPSATTNGDGFFVITDVTPGLYVVVVGYQESAYGIVEKSPDVAKTFNLEVDQIVDMGELVVRIH
jgi:hypothetical protein